jgi:hypothetical protein
MIRLHLAIAVLLCSAPAYAETEAQIVVCDKVLPSLLEFTTSLSKGMDAFDSLYTKNMDAATREIFSKVSEKSAALKLASDEFRKEFVLACFG